MINPKVSDILHTVTPKLNTNDIKPIRLGRFAVDKSRPIKIRLDNDNDVLKVIRHLQHFEKQQI